MSQEPRWKIGFGRLILVGLGVPVLFALFEGGLAFVQAWFPQDLQDIVVIWIEALFRGVFYVWVAFGGAWILNGFIGETLQNTPEDAYEAPISRSASIQLGLTILIFLAVLTLVRFLFFD